jgi:hypothetical protein
MESGSLILKPSPSTKSTVAVTSWDPFSLIASSVVVQVPDVVAADNQVQTKLAIFLDDAHWLGWVYQGNLLIPGYQVGGDPVPLRQDLMYSSSQHQWWRVRELDGTVYWDTSADGSHWDNQASSMAALELTSAFLRFVASNFGPSSAPGQARYANLNGG